jgi:hypothetical protein
MGQAAAKVIGDRSVGEPCKNLGLAGQAAEGARVQDAGAVAAEGRAVRMGRFRDGAAGQFVYFASADGEARRQPDLRVHPHSPLHAPRRRGTVAVRELRLNEKAICYLSIFIAAI